MKPVRDVGAVCASLCLALVLSPEGAAQCVALGSPGLTGCQAIPISVPAPSITCNSAPTVGNAAFKILGQNFLAAMSYPTWLAIGSCAAPPIVLPGGPFPPVPGSLCPAAPAGCIAYVDYLTPYAFVSTSGLCPPGGTWCLPIPNDPTLLGSTVCAQAIGVALGLCFQVSNGLSVTVM